MNLKLHNLTYITFSSVFLPNGCSRSVKGWLCVLAIRDTNDRERAGVVGRVAKGRGPVLPNL